MLASTSALDAADLEVLQVIATAPDSLDDRLLPALAIDVPQLRRLEGTGLLTRSRRGVGYRHELARRAVEDSIAPGVAGRLHTRVLDALEGLAGADAGRARPPRPRGRATTPAPGATPTGPPPRPPRPGRTARPSPSWSWRSPTREATRPTGPRCWSG